MGVLNFAHMQAYVDDIVTVTEAEIREAMRRIIFATRLVAEPSGAVAVAAPSSIESNCRVPGRRLRS